MLVAGIVGPLGAAAAGCQGADEYHREDRIVICAVERQECVLLDPSSGACLQSSDEHRTFHATLCYSSGAGVDTAKLCHDTFCTGDVNAPGFCQTSKNDSIIANPGVCTSLPADSAQASADVTFHSVRPGKANEDGTIPLNLTETSFTACADLSQTGAVHQLGPPSTDFSRATSVGNVIPSGCATSTARSSLYAVTPGTAATATGGGTTASLNVLRGNARVGLDCFGGGDVCLFASLADFRADLADMTVAGVPLTGLRLSLVQPAPLTSIPNGLGGTFKGVPAGGLTFAVNGKINGADAVFLVGNSGPMRVDVTTPAFRMTGQLFLDNLGPNRSSLPISVGVDTRGTPANAATSACASAPGRARLFGFEDVQSWNSSQAALSLVTSPVTQGCGALGVRGQGYMQIDGAAFTTSGLVTNSAASVDLFIPTNQPNPSWLGALQMYLTCPSGNVFNQYIGQVELTGKPTGRYSTLRFPLPAVTRSTLAQALNDCSFSFALNVNATGQTWSLDNLRFTP